MDALGIILELFGILIMLIVISMKLSEIANAIRRK